MRHDLALNGAWRIWGALIVISLRPILHEVSGLRCLGFEMGDLRWFG